MLENRLTDQGISDYLRDTYGVITSKSSIGRYASRLYDSIEAEQEGRKTPRCPMNPTDEGWLAASRNAALKRGFRACGRDQRTEPVWRLSEARKSESF